MSNEITELLQRSEEKQRAAGYFHTLREILQQPSTWIDTARRLPEHASLLRAKLEGVSSIVLTGSGSSQFAGECIAPVLQEELRVGVETIAGGALLMHGPRAFAPHRPALVISLARSGDSPESAGSLAALLAAEPDVRNLVVTCNAKGALAQTYPSDSVVLEGRTNDRSLVMTSSFTNMVLAGRYLGMLRQPERYRSVCVRLSEACERLLGDQAGTLASVAAAGFDRAVFLGTGPRFGAAREAALKMLEMTGGVVATMAQTFLGLRHGPMSYIHERTLVVCFLSSDPTLRAYETDLIAELNRKGLGTATLVVGERVAAAKGGIPIEVGAGTEIGDANTSVLHVVVGQLLAFHRCLREGMKPDSPSEDGVINRVVGSFPIHGPAGAGR